MPTKPKEKTEKLYKEIIKEVNSMEKKLTTEDLKKSPKRQSTLI